VSSAFIKEQATPAFLEGRQIWRGYFAEDAATIESKPYVILPEWHKTLRVGPCFWQSRGDMQLPKQRDICMVAFDNRRQAWIVAWWPRVPIVPDQGDILYYDDTENAFIHSRVAPVVGAFSVGTSSGGSSPIAFDTIETGNEDGWFHTTTHRYTPLVEGYYRFAWTVGAGASIGVDEFFGSALYKNGSLAVQGSRGVAHVATADVISAGFADCLHMNGTTDYVDVHALSSSGTAAATAADRTRFSGSIVGIPQ
jgi:hypothetical protein